MGSIPLYVSQGKAYCWDAQGEQHRHVDVRVIVDFPFSLLDAAALRVQHRICGLTTGTLPGVSQQNMFLGLPLVFMPEEVVLLVENGQYDRPPDMLVFTHRCLSQPFVIWSIHLKLFSRPQRAI